MTTRLEWMCHVCGSVGFKDGGDGFYYCSRCNSQADDIIETGVDEDDHDGGIYSTSHRRLRPSQTIAPEPISKVKLTQSQHLDSFEDLDEGYDNNAGDTLGPTGPSDFASYPRTLSYDDYYSEIRLRYVMGFQIMIQLQCKALVEKFNVSPLIVGLVGPIWLRFLAFSGVMSDEWADEVIHETESQQQGEAGLHPCAKHSNEPYNIFGQRAVMIWYRSLCSRIPLSYSLAINFLVCHLAREVVLPTDILKWTLEGKIPYFAVFLEIEKQLGPPSNACPISSSLMFRPTQIIPLQKLESLAAFVAQKIGLELPPVNFYGIASRFLKQLSIPSERILSQAYRMYEWSMPPEMYISVNKSRVPTRVCVMSILIVTIRIIYDLNGFGKWEMSLSSSRSSSSQDDDNGKEPTCCTDKIGNAEENFSSHYSELHENLSYDEDSKLDAAALLTSLEIKYNELRNTHEYTEDLTSYLQYCKDVVFAGLASSFEDHEEAKIIEDLWEFYQNQKGAAGEDQGIYSMGGSSLHNRPRDDRKVPNERKDCRDPEGNNASLQNQSPYCTDHNNCSSRCQNSSHEGQPLQKPHKDEAIRHLKLDMEENRFRYIPPRRHIKKSAYIHYARKIKEGAYVYASHADYYILLRACAKVAQVDLRTLHTALLNFEKRLKRLEERIDYCLRVKAPDNFCDSHFDEAQENAKDGSMDFSEFNL